MPRPCSETRKSGFRLCCRSCASASAASRASALHGPTTKRVERVGERALRGLRGGSGSRRASRARCAPPARCAAREPRRAHGAAARGARRPRRRARRSSGRPASSGERARDRRQEAHAHALQMERRRAQQAHAVALDLERQGAQPGRERKRRHIAAETAQNAVPQLVGGDHSVFSKRRTFRQSRSESPTSNPEARASRARAPRARNAGSQDRCEPRYTRLSHGRGSKQRRKTAVLRRDRDSIPGTSRPALRWRRGSRAGSGRPPADLDDRLFFSDFRLISRIFDEFQHEASDQWIASEGGAARCLRSAAWKPSVETRRS